MGSLHRYDLEHMLSTDPPMVPWVIRNFIARGEVTVLYGVGGVSKSMLCLGLAAGVTDGPRHVAGLGCNRARAAYIDAENGEWETHRRVQAFDIDPARLAMYDATGVNLLKDYDEIEKTVREVKPRLIVLDSLRRLLPGVEENDSGAMAEAMGLCKLLAQRTRAAVVVIHHSKKATKDGEAYRGSSAIADQASIVYRLSRVPGDVDRFRRVLITEKMRIAAEPPPRYLRIGFDAGRVVLDSAFQPGEGEVAPGSAAAEMVPEVLALLEQGPRTRAQVAKELGRDKADGTVRRVFEQLDIAGRIEHDEATGIWRTVATATPDVDFANRSVFVRRNRVRAELRAPKSGKVRSVPLIDQAAAALDGLSRRDNFTAPSDLVFASPVGSYLDDGDLRQRFYAALRRAGLGHKREEQPALRFHDLRHTFGTLAVQVWPLVDVQAYMGHANISTTMIYAHSVPKHDAADALSALVAGSASARLAETSNTVAV